MDEQAIINALRAVQLEGSASACDRVASAGARLVSRPRRRRRNVLVGAAAALALALTPPVQSLAENVAHLVGFGENPTLPQSGAVSGSASVLQSGSTPDGEPYEIVAKVDHLGRQGGNEMLCFQVDWLELQGKGAGGACTSSYRDGSANDPPLETSGLFTRPGDDVADGAIFMGIADDPRVTDVEVHAVTRDGAEVAVPTSFLTVSGDLLKRTGGSFPVSIFAATIDGALRQEADQPGAKLIAVGYDAEGQEVDRQPTLQEQTLGRSPAIGLGSALESVHGQLKTVGGLGLATVHKAALDQVKSDDWAGASALEAAKYAIGQGPQGAPVMPNVYLARMQDDLVYVVELMIAGTNSEVFVLSADDLRELYAGTWTR